MSYYSGSYGAGMGAALLIPSLLSLAVSILLIIAQWRLFTKADEAGWKCLIPFYGQYTWCRIVWSAKIFWIMLGIGFGMGILSGILTAAAANRYGSPGTASVILGILILAAVIWLLVIAIRMVIYTARAYGKSGGFAVGLFFLAPIFLCILAFGDSEYVGPMGTAGGRTAGSRTERNASGYAIDVEAKEETDSSRHSLIWIIVGVCALILGYAAVKRFILAATDFKAARGIFASPWVGFENFQFLLANRQLPAVVRNSLISGFITLLLSMLFSLLGGAAGMSGSRSGKAIAAAFGAAIAFVPSVVFDSVLICARMAAAQGFQPLLPIVHALPIAGVSLLLGALLPAAWPRRSRFPAILIAPLLTLASFFMDHSAVNLLRNALNRQYTETFSTYIYELFMVGRFSVSAAAEIIQSLLNLIPALAGALLIGFLVKKSSPAARAVPEKSGAGASVMAGAAAGGMIILAGALLFSRAPSVLQSGSVVSACVTSLVTALLVTALGFGIYFAVLLCAGRFDSRRWLPFALLVLLFAGFNRTSIAVYLTARNLGLMNTVVMPVLYAVANPLSLMLLLGVIIIRPQRVSSCVLSALGAALLSAAYVTGDVSAFYLYVVKSSGQNLGMLLRNMWMSSDLSSLSGIQSDAAAADNLRMGLMGVQLLFIGLPVGIGTALCVHASLQKD